MMFAARVRTTWSMGWAHRALGLTDPRRRWPRMYANARAASLDDGPDGVHDMVVSRRILGVPGRRGWDFAEGGPAA